MDRQSQFYGTYNFGRRKMYGNGYGFSGHAVQAGTGADPRPYKKIPSALYSRQTAAQLNAGYPDASASYAPTLGYGRKKQRGGSRSGMRLSLPQYAGATKLVLPQYGGGVQPAPNLKRGGHKLVLRGEVYDGGAPPPQFIVRQPWN
jgi:hypothetical protein